MNNLSCIKEIIKRLESEKVPNIKEAFDNLLVNQKEGFIHTVDKTYATRRHVITSLQAVHGLGLDLEYIDLDSMVFSNNLIIRAYAIASIDITLSDDGRADMTISIPSYNDVVKYLEILEGMFPNARSVLIVSE